MATEIRRLLFNKGVKTTQSNINLCIQIIAKQYNVDANHIIDLIIDDSNPKKSTTHQKSFELEDFPEDILTTIMMNTDKYNISGMCLSNKNTLKICSDEYFWAQKFKKDFGYMKIIESKENETWKNNYKNMIKSLEKTEKMIDQIEKGEDDGPLDKWSLAMKGMGNFLKSKPYFVLTGLYDYDRSNLVNDEFIHQILPKNISTKLKKELDDESLSEGTADLYSIMFKYKGNYKKYASLPFTVLLNVSDFFGIGASQHITRKDLEILLEKINFYYPNSSLVYFDPDEG